MKYKNKIFFIFLISERFIEDEEPKFDKDINLENGDSIKTSSFEKKKKFLVILLILILVIFIIFLVIILISGKD